MDQSFAILTREYLLCLKRTGISILLFAIYEWPPSLAEGGLFRPLFTSLVSRSYDSASPYRADLKLFHFKLQPVSIFSF